MKLVEELVFSSGHGMETVSGSLKVLEKVLRLESQLWGRRLVRMKVEWLVREWVVQLGLWVAV
jgi:hypothetical protein